jgi:assimilatory nitrate reductase electron transfer subunit
MTSAPSVVVIGNGMAGLRFVQDLLDLAAACVITVIGDEPGAAYNRTQLPHVLSGTASEDSIELAADDWYADRGVRLVPRAARRIDRHSRAVELADGTFVSYDTLVLATGSTSVLPPVEGLITRNAQPSPGAVAFRTLADCTEIRARAKNASQAIVLGGGVLGLETARGLALGGLPVTLVQRGRRLMDRQLDAGASRVLARTARSLGIAVRTGAGLRQVRTGPRSGEVTGLVLDDGTTLDTDLLVLCCGTRPNAVLAREAGLAVNVGIVVDDGLRSVTDPRILAIGDCAEHRGRTHGLVASAWAQAQAAARGVAGFAPARGAAGGGRGAGPIPASTAQASPIPASPAQASPVQASPVQASPAQASPVQASPIPASPVQASPAQAGHAGLPEVVRLKADGIELAVLGEAGRGGGGAGEVVRFTDSARGIYQKLVIRDGRLAGAILLGDTRTAGTLTQLLDRGTPLPADRMSLLAPRAAAAGGASETAAGSPVTMPGTATICHCNGVSKAAICAAWENGARDTAQVAAKTRASTGCGTCRDAVEGIVSWLASADPGAASGTGGATAPEPSPRLVPA